MKSKLLLPLIVILLSFTSCTKDQVAQTLENSSVSVVFKVAGVWIDLSIGNGGGYYYDQSAYANYYDPNNNVTTTIGYITSYPLDETRIVIHDQNGAILGTANLPSGTGSQMNVAITNIRNWFSNGGGRLPVLVTWNQKFTNAPWDGTIIGY